MNIEDKLNAAVAKYMPDERQEMLNEGGAALVKAVYERLHVSKQNSVRVVYAISDWVELVWGKPCGEHLTLGSYGDNICHFHGRIVGEDGRRSYLSGEVHADSLIPQTMLDHIDKIINSIEGIDKSVLAKCQDETVTAPTHYTAHPSGVECITITEHMTFNIGNAVKYLWRAGLKDANPSIQDLQKAAWYIDREIKNHKNI